MSHQVEMTQHPPHSPTLSNEPEDLEEEISRKLKILDFATLVLSHPSMTQAVREMAMKDLGTVTKKTTTSTDLSMPETSTSSTAMHWQHASTGTPIIASRKDLPTSLTTSSQSPVTGSSQNTQPTSTSTTLSTGSAHTVCYRRTKKNWQDSQKEKAIQRRKTEKKKENTSKSPASKHPDLQVAQALDEIFGMLLAETETNNKQKTE